MQDSRIAVVERALTSLAHLTEVGGGDFLRRRMKKEAWPLLSQLLKQGLALASHHRRGAHLAIQEAQAPAILGRVRLATVIALDRSLLALLRGKLLRKSGFPADMTWQIATRDSTS